MNPVQCLGQGKQTHFLKQSAFAISSLKCALVSPSPSLSPVALANTLVTHIFLQDLGETGMRETILDEFQEEAGAVVFSRCSGLFFPTEGSGNLNGEGTPVCTRQEEHK